MGLQRWEYRTVKVAASGWFGPKVDEAQVDERLNGLGMDGWELATAFDTNWGHGATQDIILVFKRPAK